MSQTFVRICCKEEKLYVAFYPGEPSVLICENHYEDKAFLIGAKKIINIITGEEVKIADL